MADKAREVEVKAVGGMSKGKPVDVRQPARQTENAAQKFGRK